jgi:hypothetical protein
MNLGEILYKRHQERVRYTAVQFKDISNSYQEYCSDLAKAVAKEIISLMLFMDSWRYDNEQIESWLEDNNKFVVEIVSKYSQYMIPARNNEHVGDCTKDPWTCDRCTIEDYDKLADKLIAIIERTNNG